MITCPLKYLTNLDCPFCGGQRAVVAIFNGEFSEAFWLNPVLFCLGPYLMMLGIALMSSRVRATKIGSWCAESKTILTVLGIFMAWGVVRNIIKL